MCFYVIFCLSLQKFAIEQKLFLPHCLTYPVNTNGETITIFRFGSWKCARYLFWIGSWTGAVGIVLNGNYFVISWILDSFFFCCCFGFSLFFSGNTYIGVGRFRILGGGGGGGGGRARFRILGWGSNISLAVN